MRNMSFAMTTAAVLVGTKSVTRRYGWRFLKVGDLVRPVEKCMGLRRGEKMKPLRGPIRIIGVRREPLMHVLFEEGATKKEGLPEMSVSAFIEMITTHYRTKAYDEITRIEFEYTD